MPKPKARKTPLGETRRPDGQNADGPLLGLARDDDGLPTITAYLAVGMEAAFIAPLMFPTVKEHEARETGAKSLTRITQEPSRVDVGHSHYESAVTVVTEFLHQELKGLGDGGLGSAFVSVETGHDGPFVRLYAAFPGPQHTGVDSPVTGLGQRLEQALRDSNLRVVVRGITSADSLLLDAMWERVRLHCALTRCRTLFARLPGEGEGIDAGARESLRRANRPG